MGFLHRSLGVQEAVQEQGGCELGEPRWHGRAKGWVRVYHATLCLNTDILAHIGKYTWLERSYDDEDDVKDKPKSKKASASGSEEVEEKVPDCTLSKDIQVRRALTVLHGLLMNHRQVILKLIFNVS